MTPLNLYLYFYLYLNISIFQYPWISISLSMHHPNASQCISKISCCRHGWIRNGRRGPPAWGNYRSTRDVSDIPSEDIYIHKND